MDDLIKIKGTITKDGSPYEGVLVEIQKSNSGHWNSMGTDTTNSNGVYNIPLQGWYTVPADQSKNDDYRMYIGGTQVDEKYIGDWTTTATEDGWKVEAYWSYTWDYSIPEFATIAIPVAGILGLMFFFNRRKHKKE